MSKIKLNLKEEGVIYFINILFQKIIAFITLTFLANNIIPEIFGQYIYILSLVSIFILISHFGIPILLVKNISSKKHKVSEHNSLCSSIIFSFLLSFFTQIVIYFFLKLFFKNLIDLEVLNLVFVYLILTSIYQISSSICIGLSFPVKGQWPEIYLKNLFFLFIIIFYKDLNLVLIFKSLIFLTLLSVFIIFISLFNPLKYYFKNFYYFKFEKKVVYSLISLGLASLLSSIITRMDVFMIEYYLDYKHVAIYNIAFQVGLIPLFLAISINAILSPKVSELFAKRHFQKLNVILGSSRLIFFIFNVIFLMFYKLFLLKIFSFIFPELYSLSLTYSYFFIYYCVFISLVYFADTCLVMTGNQKIVIYSYLFAIIFNFILNVLLIPVFGVRGALIGTIISLITFNLINFFALRLIIKKKTRLKKIIFLIIDSLKKEKSKILSTYVNFRK